MISIVAAICNGRGLGKNGGIPWLDPYDLARFKIITKKQIVIMGSKTWKSLGLSNRPLKMRDNFVISSNPKEVFDQPMSWDTSSQYSLQVFDCPDCALEKATYQSERTGQGIWIIGGQQVYESVLDNTEYLYLTEIAREYECDRFFPEFESKFECISCENHPEDQDIVFKVYRKK